MYFPKSQVKTNLYTNGGELSRLDTNEDYVGYYWETSSGKIYAGKNPQQLPLVELLKKQAPTEEAVPLFKPTTWVTNYSEDVVSNNLGMVPGTYKPEPSEEDYQFGEIQRYFTKKTNQNIYYEISKEDYTKIDSKSNSILWQLYLAIEIPWIISGNEKDVAQTNYNIVVNKEITQKLPGFRKVFRKNFLQLYKKD